MVAIKGIEMPKSCANCDRFLGACKYTDFGDYQTERNPSCPLVEIIPCKECKHNGTMRCKCFMHDEKEYMSFHYPDFFCADAERRE